jgi:hypothetical protein
MQKVSEGRGWGTGDKKNATHTGKAFSTCVDEIRRQPLGLKALSHISNG